MIFLAIRLDGVVQWKWAVSREGGGEGGRERGKMGGREGGRGEGGREGKLH